MLDVGSPRRRHKLKPKKKPRTFAATDELWAALHARTEQLRLNSVGQLLSILAYNDLASPNSELVILPAPGSAKPSVSPDVI